MQDRDIHPLLTPDEVALLDRVAGTGDKDLARLRDAVWRLAKLKMHEGVFPEYAAIIDHARRMAFASRLVEKLPVGRNQLIWEEGKTPTKQLLYMTPECPITDIFLLVRPCLRIADSVSRSTRERLADLGRLCVTVQNLPLRSPENAERFHTPIERSKVAHHIWKGPLVDFLADENGYGMQRQPSVLAAPAAPITGIFGTGRLDEQQLVYPYGLGVFLAGETVVSVDLNYPILGDETVVLDTGLVMARYTTSGGKIKEEGLLDTHEIHKR